MRLLLPQAKKLPSAVCVPLIDASCPLDEGTNYTGDIGDTFCSNMVTYTHVLEQQSTLRHFKKSDEVQPWLFSNFQELKVGGKKPVFCLRISHVYS